MPLKHISNYYCGLNPIELFPYKLFAVLSIRRNRRNIKIIKRKWKKIQAKQQFGLFLFSHLKKIAEVLDVGALQKVSNGKKTI